MSAKTDKCSDNNKSVCDYNDFSRLRFFHGMLLDDKDFRAEQQYHANKRRFLNRMLHGSGVVCGLELQGEKEKRTLTVTSGFALDCSGNEIWVPHEVPIDICSLLPPTQNGKGPCDKTEKGDPKSYCIGIRYKEKQSSPVSVYRPSGSCEERTCENSRIQEGYCVEIVDCCAEDKHEPKGVLKHLCDCRKASDMKIPTEQSDRDRSAGNCRKCNKPGPNATPEQKEEWCECIALEDFCGKSPKCPECCCSDDPCFVVLGKITVDEKCQLVSICNNDCRRYVITGNLLRHMFIGAFDGYESNVEFKAGGVTVDLLSATEIADNPIKALCWVLENIISKQAKPVLKDCSKKDQIPPPPPQMVDLNERIKMMEERSARLNEEVQMLRGHFIQLNTDVNDVRVDNLVKKNPSTQEPSDKKSKK